MTAASEQATRFLEALELQSARSSVDVEFFAFGSASSGISCTVGCDVEGTIFVAAALHPHGEPAAIARAGLAGIRMASHKGHAYAPTQWILLELGDTLESLPKRRIIDHMTTAVRAHLPVARIPRST